MRRVFRDYTVLLASNRLTMGLYADLLSPLGFGRIETTHDSQKVLPLLKRLKANLVVASGGLSVFSGAQLLSAARKDKLAQSVPFLILGDKEDLKPGGLADNVAKIPLARFAALPLEKEQFARVILELLDPLIDPGQEEAYGCFDEGDDFSRQGKFKEAAEKYKKGLDLFPNCLDVWLRLGAAECELGKYEDSENAYFKALRINNFCLPAYIGLADIYERSEEYEQTIGILNQALGVAKIVKTGSKSVSKINFFIGEFELRLKRLTGAEKSFEQAIEYDQENANLQSDIGDAYSTKGYFAESEKHYQAALGIDPNLAHVFNKLGIAYRRQGKFEKALQLYDNARLHHPEDEHLLFNIARAHLEAARPHEAQVLLEEALLMAPEFKAAKFLIARLGTDELKILDAVPDLPVVKKRIELDKFGVPNEEEEVEL
ncbi:MAG: tetratricopeptide repeat protein [Pseudomonadota bacterium]